MPQVKLIALTQPVGDATPCKTAEDLIVYEARVSSPQNQDSLDTGPKLLRYCIRHKHWSVFDQADMTVEITTSRAISAQILRHKSFSFQEHSLRYSEALGFETHAARRQDTKNRQNSVDDLDDLTQTWFREAQAIMHRVAETLYREALDKEVAKECARFLLPLATTTRFYMKGSVRSWIHYFAVRREAGTQLEHREIADEIWEIFKAQFPVVTEALENEVST